MHSGLLKFWTHPNPPQIWSSHAAFVIMRRCFGLNFGASMPNKHKHRSVALSLGLFLFSIYLLSYRGGFHSVDEVSMFAVTESLAKFGQFNTDQIAWTQWTTSQAEAQGFFGQDGRVYSKKGLALSLAQLPLYFAALHLPIGMLQTVSLLNALLTAATTMIIFLFIRRLGFSRFNAVLLAFIFGLTTIASVYAKYLFSEPLAALLLVLAAYMLLIYGQNGAIQPLIIAGLAAGFAVVTRANNLFLLPIFGLYLGWVASRGHHSFLTRSTLKALVAFGLALAIPGAVLLGYNAVRAGNPLQTGYDLTLFSSNFLLGFYKLLFSPLRGLFIYSPILLLSLPGWWRLRSLLPTEAWLFAGCIGVTVGLFSFWSSGEGLSWGSRFLVPIVPFLVICLAPVTEEVLGSRGAEARGRRGANIRGTVEISPPSLPKGGEKSEISPFGGLGGRSSAPPNKSLLRPTFYLLLPLSFIIQLLGVAINPWVFLAQLQANFGGEFFLENTEALYDFRYSQIVGQVQHWSLENSDLAWLRWGFDGWAFGLSFGLVLLSSWFLWSNVARAQRSGEPGGNSPLRLRSPAPLLILTLVVTYLLLIRYDQTDQQFGPPDDAYTRALSRVTSEAAPNDSILTVAQYHYHVPMNRFKQRRSITGFAQQTWPPPATAQPLLEAAAAGQNIWLITIGFPPAAADNAAEQWLSLNHFKAGDEWLDDSVRLARYSPTQPTETRPIDARFGPEEIVLVEVQLIKSLAAGQNLPVKFTWHALQPPEADYNLFLQLLNIEGALVAQHDSPPNGGYSPTSAWQPEAVVIARHALTLPKNLPGGDYRLIAGLYQPYSGERLLVDDQRTFVELGNVTIIGE